MDIGSEIMFYGTTQKQSSQNDNVGRAYMLICIIFKILHNLGLGWNFKMGFSAF